MSRLEGSANTTSAIQTLLKSLRRASQTPTKQRGTHVSDTIDGICNHAYQLGLNSTAIGTIIDIVTARSELDQTSVTNLIKNLYPRERVPSQIVVRIVSGLGQGYSKPSTSTQNALLKWLITVFTVLDDARILSKVYALLFNLLDMISIRTSLCHLLSLVTRRRHVRPFRIQYLLELSRGVAAEPALTALLRVYKDYYPDIIIGRTATGRTSLPPHPDSDWSRRLRVIQNTATHERTAGEGGRNGFKVSRNTTRSNKHPTVGEVHTSHASETSVTLEEIEDADDFVQKIERIELPNQMVVSLRDPLFQKYITLYPQDIATQRLDFWLTGMFADEIDLARRKLPASNHLGDILNAIASYADANKTIPPLIQTFLLRYLPLWDGSNVDSVLSILRYLDTSTFQEAHDKYFRYIEAALLGRPDGVYHLLGFYTSLARTWTLKASLLSTPSSHTTALASHFDLLATTLLSTRPSPHIYHSAILTFYESLIPLPTNTPTHPPPILFPTPPLLYTLIFSPTLSTLSRLTSLLTSLKPHFSLSNTYPPALTTPFNAHTMDIVNLLFRSRALNTTDHNALGCLCPAPTITSLSSYLPDLDHEYSLASSWGVSHHFLLSSISQDVMEKLEDREEAIRRGELNARHAGPVTGRSLERLSRNGGASVRWKEYRVTVLKALEERGLGGMKEMVFAAIVGLGDAR